MSAIAIQSSGSGAGTLTIAAPITATNRTLTLPDATGTILTTATAGVPINGPAFSAYASSATTITNATWTKLTFNVETFDTNTNFASNRFTPTVAGYYQLSASWQSSFTTSFGGIAFYKNGTAWQNGSFTAATSVGTQAGASALIYFNGSTDYVEIYAYQATGISQNTTATSSDQTWFSGAMIRSAV